MFTLKHESVNLQTYNLLGKKPFIRKPPQGSHFWLSTKHHQCAGIIHANIDQQLSTSIIGFLVYTGFLSILYILNLGCIK